MKYAQTRKLKGTEGKIFEAGWRPETCWWAIRKSW